MVEWMDKLAERLKDFWVRYECTLKETDLDDIESSIEIINKHDSLVAEVDRLKQELEEYRNLKMVNTLDENKILKQANTDLKNDRIFAKTNIEKLKEENEKLKEALRKCDPFIAHTGSKLNVCEFCLDRPHTDDCEYVILTKLYT
jgi:hypothetical protein